MKKRFIALIMCACMLTGCSVSINKKDSGTQVTTKSSDEVCKDSSEDMSDYIKNLEDSNCSLTWDYNGSVIVDKVTLRETSSGTLNVSYDDNLRFVDGFVNHEVYNNSGVDTLDYYVDSNNTFYSRDIADEEVLLSYNDIDLIADIKTMLLSCNFRKDGDDYIGKHNLSAMSDTLYRYLFGEKFVSNSDLNVDVTISTSGNKIDCVDFKLEKFQGDVSSVNELSIAYKFSDSYELSVSKDYTQIGLPNIVEEFEYPSGYTYSKGYAFPYSSLEHYTSNKEGYGYGDYILDGSCLVDTSKVKSYSIFSGDKDNVNNLGSIVYSYTNSNNSYNYNPIYIQVFSYGHSELSDNLMNLYNSYCESYRKITPKDGEETRYFTVTYTVPIDSSKIYYEPRFDWYAGVDDCDAITCNDVTEVTSTSTFRLGGGCQITKYYVYCIDKNATGEWFSTYLRDGLNSSSAGNVYWR